MNIRFQADADLNEDIVLGLTGSSLKSIFRLQVKLSCEDCPI